MVGTSNYYNAIAFTAAQDGNGRITVISADGTTLFSNQEALDSVKEGGRGAGNGPIYWGKWLLEPGKLEYETNEPLQTTPVSLLPRTSLPSSSAYSPTIPSLSRTLWVQKTLPMIRPSCRFVTASSPSITLQELPLQHARHVC
jgi:hypothetical protein